MSKISEPCPEDDTSALRFVGIQKAFFGIPVLRGIDFAVGRGKTQGLVGENGAGKSTLMNILGGSLKPDAGSLYLWGELYNPQNPRDAESKGIAFVHQELNLFGNLNIAENLFLNAFPKKRGLIDRPSIQAQTRAVLAKVGLELSPETLVEQLSAGERQLVEISRAICRDAKLIILDEPTTSLTDHEAEHLFEILNRLKNEGVTLIYISHALEEVRQLADDLLILRDGVAVAHGPQSTFTTKQTIALMVGRDIDNLFPERTHRPTEKPALTVSGLCKRGTASDIAFALRQGEVLGISGLMGSGRTELARILFGLDPADAGDVLLDGKPILDLSTRERIASGMAFLTEDRREEGLCLEASIAENMTLACAERYASRPLGWLNRGSLDEGVREYRNAVRLTPGASNDQAAKTLSGGNQQKVVLAKWLLNKPTVVILDEPTRGIDVGAKYEVYSLINQMTADGAAVLVISSELEELIGICDRILAMKLGEITAEFDRSQFDRERILQAALH